VETIVNNGDRKMADRANERYTEIRCFRSQELEEYGRER
jgi:hypothetical protein